MWIIKKAGCSSECFEKQKPWEIISSCFVGVSWFFFTPVRYSTNSRKAYNEQWHFSAPYPKRHHGRSRREPIEARHPLTKCDFFNPYQVQRVNPYFYRGFLQKKLSQKIDLPYSSKRNLICNKKYQYHGYNKPPTNLVRHSFKITQKVIYCNDLM